MEDKEYITFLKECIETGHKQFNELYELYLDSINE